MNLTNLTRAQQGGDVIFYTPTASRMLRWAHSNPICKGLQLA